MVTQPRSKRLNKAVKYIRERVSHYTKIKQDNVKLSKELNTLIFKKYARTMVPLKLNVKIGTDTADVFPFSEKKQQAPAQKETAKKDEKAKKQEPAAQKQQK